MKFKELKDRINSMDKAINELQMNHLQNLLDNHGIAVEEWLKCYL